MESIKIEGKEYKLYWGIGFSKRLSKIYSMKQNIKGNDMEFSLGIRMAVPYLEMGDPVAIFNVLKSALAKYDIIPTDDKLEDAIDELAVKYDGFDGLSDEIIEALKASGFYKKAFKEMEEDKKTVQADQ